MQEVQINPNTPSQFTGPRKNISHHIASGNYGSLNFYRLKGEGYTIWYNTYLPTKDIQLTKKYSYPFLGLAIMHKNGMKFSLDGIGELYINENEFCFAYLPHIQTKTDMLKDKQYETFSIHFSAYLVEGLNKRFPGLNELLRCADHYEPYLLFNEAVALSLDMITIVNEIINNNFVRYKKMYTELKVKELLLRAFEHMQNQYKKPTVNLNTEDIEILKKLPELLINNIDNPLTIRELSRKVGLNILKLKVGFKRLYGLPIKQFIINVRLEKAYKLVSETDNSIAEVAAMVGYQNSSSLTRAFKAFYGFTLIYLRINKNSREPFT